jgi:hypothetical protein
MFTEPDDGAGQVRNILFIRKQVFTVTQKEVVSSTGTLSIVHSKMECENLIRVGKMTNET